jgi:hypothetical protein
MADEKSASQLGINYHIMISRVDETQFDNAAGQFSKLFNITPESAGQILKSIPVVFLSNLARNDIKTIKPKLVDLSKLGIEFTISPQLSQSIPKVIWPTQPHYKEGPAGNIVQYVDFQWKGNAFVCPNCGETFVFQRVGNPFNTYQKVKEQMPQRQQPHPVPAEAEITEGEDVMVLAPVVEPSAESEDGVMELNPVEAQSEWADENASEPIDILQPEAVSEEGVSSEQGAEEIAEPEMIEEPPVEEANCTVFLSGLSSAEKREKAAKIISEIKNIPLEKAQELTNRVLVPVLKDVTETEANECLEMFKKVGVSGRITKKK